MATMLNSMIATLTLAEKVNLNQVLAASIAAAIGTAPLAIATADKPVKGKKAKDPNAPKKAAAQGVLAWNAFVKHCKATQPTLFEGIKLEKERLAICGNIKVKDIEAYKAWVAEWIQSHPASATVSPAASDTEEEAPKTKGRPKKTDEEKAAAKKEKKDKKTVAPAPAPTPAAPAVAPTSAVDQEGDMVKRDINGKKYLMDPASRNLYSTDDKYEAVGDFVGKFRPGNATEPIDFDAEEN